MTGGGFGGSAVVLLEIGATGAVTAAVARAFAERGYRPPETTEVAASGGASRLA